MELPAPAPQALAASRALLERIAAELSASGNWISFARYMELALYEPGLGYYAAGSHKLGAGGDFVSAPELSPVFARTLARQAAQILQPGEAILEFGAGTGMLAEVLLSELKGVKYEILETSPELRQRVGDMDSVSDAALRSGAELLVHSYVDGRAPGADRLRALGIPFKVVSAPVVPSTSSSGRPSRSKSWTSR